MNNKLKEVNLGHDIGEILKGVAFILLGILSVFVLDGEGTVALFLVPIGIYYIYMILKGEKFDEC